MKRTTLHGLALLAGLLVAALGHDAFAAPPSKPGAGQKRPAGDQAAATREATYEERVERARLLFLAADEKFKAGDFAGALAGFRAVNDVARSPHAVFRVALCLEKVGTRVEAEDAFHRFLGLPPPESMADEKRIAGERIAELNAGTLRISSYPAAATVAIDGKPAVATPVEVRLPAGRHVVLASAPEHEPASSVIDVPRGGTTELAVALAPVPPAAPPPAPEQGPVTPAGITPASTAPVTPLVAGVTAFGLAAVGLAVGTAFGVRALNAQSDYHRTPSLDLADRESTSAVIADSAIGAAVVFAAVGTVLVTQRQAAAPARAASRTWQVIPVLSPRAQGAAAVFRF